MSTKPTLTTQVADLRSDLAALIGLVTPLVKAQVEGQHATPAAVAEATAPAKTEKVVTLVKAEKSASDVLKEAVEAKGLAFARGGRTVLTLEHCEALVRVLKTGTPEILPIKATQGRTHIAIGRDGKGKTATVITQYVYTPDSE